MNPNPPFHRRGFGFGPHLVAFHDQAANTPLQWATFALVLFVAVTLVVLVVVRIARGRRRHDDPLAVLRMRLAKGSIGRDEFLQATADLAPPAPPS